MAPFFIPFLAFCCLVPIQIDATAAKSEMELANRDLELPSKNNNAHRIGSGEQNGEVNQFVRELFDQYSKIAAILYTGGQAKVIDYSMIKATLYGDSQSSAEAIKWQNSNSNVDGLVDGINKINLSKNDKDRKKESADLMDEFEILKTIDQLDKPMVNLLKKLHNSISDLIDSVNGGKNDGQNAKLQNLKTINMEAVMKLAELWSIPLNEIKQIEKEQNIDQKSILKELAKFWHKFKRQKGQNEKKKSDQKRKDDQKRILKLIMDLSIDGIDRLANLKGGAKKRESRRRRRRKRFLNTATNVALVGIGILLLLLLAFNIVSKCTKEKGPTTSDIEAPNVSEERREEPQRQPTQAGANSNSRPFPTRTAPRDKGPSARHTRRHYGDQQGRREINRGRGVPPPQSGTGAGAPMNSFGQGATQEGGPSSSTGHFQYIWEGPPGQYVPPPAYYVPQKSQEDQTIGLCAIQ